MARIVFMYPRCKMMRWGIPDALAPDIVVPDAVPGRDYKPAISTRTSASDMPGCVK